MDDDEITDNHELKADIRLRSEAKLDSEEIQMNCEEEIRPQLEKKGKKLITQGSFKKERTPRKEIDESGSKRLICEEPIAEIKLEQDSMSLILKGSN